MKPLTLAERLEGTPYDSYLYAYPHKTAYRALDPPRPLADVWSRERTDALFLYLHVPFCEMRCGFCNLFTTPRPKDDLVEAYLGAIERQARSVREALPHAGFSRFALGGGTPTLLAASQMARLLDVAERIFGADLAGIPGSVETSPETCSTDVFGVLAERGIDRVSIGIQSFVEDEARAVARPQRSSDVERALEHLRAAGFPTLNVDLMYGLPGQTLASWQHSLERALAWRAEEIYVYPLYVRPVTTLSRRSRDWDDERLSMYRLARDRLREAGYLQLSMRMFRAPHAPGAEGPVYCVQDDGMVGLGPGARSYTRALHYSSEWAVGARGVLDIIGAWLERSDAEHALCDHGIVLDGDEQRRRWVMISLFIADGLDLAAYRERFGADVLEELPELRELVPELASLEAGRLSLTDRGIELSDTLGPHLYSERVRALMGDYRLR